MQETTRNEPNGRQEMKWERIDKVKNNIERMRLTMNGEICRPRHVGSIASDFKGRRAMWRWCMHRVTGIEMSGNDCTLIGRVDTT